MVARELGWALGCAAMAVVILSEAGEAAALSLWVSTRSGNRRQTQASAARMDRRRVRLAASRSGGASKRLTDGAEESCHGGRTRVRGRRGRWEAEAAAAVEEEEEEECRRVCRRWARRIGCSWGRVTSCRGVVVSLRRVGWEGRMKQRCDGRATGMRSRCCYCSLDHHAAR